MATANLRTLTVSVKANTAQFSRGMRKMRGELVYAGTATNRFRDAATSAMVALRGMWTAAAGPAALAYGLWRLMSASERFNREMRSSLAIMGKVSESTRKIMQDTAFQVARDTKFAADEVAKSYFFLASAGLDAAQSIKALPAVAQFAQAGMFDMAMATDLLTDAQSALGLSTRDALQNLTNMLRISDTLVKANTLANASVQQFSESLTTKAGAALRFVNKSVEEGVAVLAVFADQGIKAAEAGTALNIILRDLSTKAIQNRDAFAAAGIAVFDASGAMRNVADIIGDLENALEGLSDKQKKATMLQLGFSDKSIVFQQALLGSSEKVRELEAALRDASGITREIADKQLTPFAKAWNKLTAAFAKFGNALSPLVTGFSYLLEALAFKAEGVALLAKTILGLPGTIWRANMAVMKWMFEIEKVPAETIEATNAVRDLATGLDDVASAGERAGRGLRIAMRRAPSMRKQSDEQSRLRREIELSMRTPEEVLAHTVNRLNLLFDYGAKNAETYRRALKRAHDEFRDAIGELDRHAQSMSDAQTWIASLRTPQEHFRQQFAELRKLYSEGLIDTDIFARGLKHISKELVGALDINAPTAGVSRFAREIRLSQVPIAGLSPQRQTQAVRDPQFIEANAHLKVIREKISVGTAVTSP